MMAKETKSAKAKDKLSRLICKFPSEFDQGKLRNAIATALKRLEEST